MKKALAVLFVLVLSLGLLAGCGDPGTTDPGTTENGAATGGVDNEKVIRISVSGTPVIDPAVGITNIVDKAEMKEKLTAWLAEHNA